MNKIVDKSGNVLLDLSGGEWELLREITLTEKVSDLIINQDSDGNYFWLSAMAYSIDAPTATTDTGTVDLYVGLGDKPNVLKNERRCGYHQNGVSTRRRTSCGISILTNKLFAMHNTEDSLGNNVSVQCLNNNFNNDVNSYPDKKIIRLAKKGASVLPVGTVIRVFGIRA